MSQIQCPNCGSYKISIRDQGYGIALLYTILFGWFIGLGGCFMMSASLDLTDGIGGALSMFCSGLPLFAAGWGPIILVMMTRKNYLVKCDTCGREWDTRREK